MVSRASSTKLQPGEDSIERVADALPSKGPYRTNISIRLWSGELKRYTIQAKTKGEFRRKARDKREVVLNSSVSSWTKAKKIADFIDDVSFPLIEGSRIRENTKKRYNLAISQLKDKVGDLAIGDAVKVRNIERVLRDIGEDHGKESARQARTVLSKYVIDQLIREDVIDHNPIRGLSIDFGDVRKGSKPTGGKALTDAQYDSVVSHLIDRDTSLPIPPGTDKRYTSIVKHDRTVALTLLQAATGLRISEALSLTKKSVIDNKDGLHVTVTSDVSKTHRARTVPFLDKRVEDYWRERLINIRQSDPLISAPGDKGARWRTDNAVKACAALYKDVGKTLKDPVVSEIRSHSWRTTLNNRAIAQGVSSDVRAAFFGHDQSVNKSAYTDLQDVSSMRRILAGGVKEKSTQESTQEG